MKNFQIAYSYVQKAPISEVAQALQGTQGAVAVIVARLRRVSS